MTAGDASGTVTICKGQGLFLRADDAGVLVRNFYGRARRIAWTEISHFADGQYTKEGVTGWQLFIVLRTGKRVRVTSSVLAPADEVVAAVRKAAQPHGVPADLAGIPVKKGQPAVRGFYEAPGGQVGVRYWDGTRWSPLLPPDASRPPTVGWWPYEGTARKSCLLYTSDAADGRGALDIRRDPGQALDGGLRRHCGRVAGAAGWRAGGRAVVGSRHVSQAHERRCVVHVRRDYRAVRT